MIWLYAVCFAVIGIIMFFYAMKAYHMESTLKVEVSRLLGMAALTIFFYSIALVCRSYFRLSLAYSLYFICYDGMIYYLFLFCRKYTNAEPLGKWTKRLLLSLLICDMVSLFLNPFLKDVVTFGIMNPYERVFSILEMKLPYKLHLALCYCLFVLCIIKLIRKMFKSASIYKVKYGALCIVLLLVAFLNGLFVFTRLSVDFSILIFSMAGILIHSFAFTYIPNKLQACIIDYFIQVSADGILSFDEDNKCIYANPMAANLFRQKSLIDDKDVFCEKWGISPQKRELELVTKGETRILAFSFKDLEDKENRRLGSVFWFHDITMEKRLVKETVFLSRYDTLTNIYNRNYFFYQVRHLMEKTSQTMRMVSINVERFKLLNDIYGFEAGNLLLNEIAEALKAVKIDDYVYGRIDSDWFAVCIPRDYPIEKRFDEFKIKSPELSYIRFPIVLKLGVYEIDDKTIPPEVMYDRAMLTLNGIKGLYHTQIGYYDETLRNKLLAEQIILDDMERAIQEKQFVVYLQPQMNHSTNRIVGAEALVRWDHPERGRISPAEFIPLFEANGFITKLDQYVWETVCQIIQRMRKEGPNYCSISVNISTKDFYYADLYEVFTGLIAKYQIPPESLKLEITESAFIMDLDKQVSLIRKLQKAGFIIEMDDFGSGYSSLNTLKDIPVDILKMDMKFLSDSQDVERSKNILEMVVSLSKNLGMRVISEGVETKKQADYLSEIGCDNIQGYYYAKPMDLKEYEKYLTRYEYQDIMTDKTT